MERLLPSRVDPRPRDDPKVYGLEEEQTQDALSALSAETAREILTKLYDEPAAPAELQKDVGTSLQNVHYHLDNLESADLIRQVGTRYSEKGNEMAVFAPASDAVVFMAGDNDSRSRLQRALARVVGGVGVLAAASLAFGAAVQRWLAPEPSSTGSEPVIQTEQTDTAAEVVNAIDPALAFFLGGAFVLAVVGSWMAIQHRRSDG